MTTRTLLVGVDGGQTATKVLVVDSAGRVLGSGQGRSVDHFRARGGAERNRAAFDEGIGQALAAAGAGVERVAAVAFGLTGVPTGGPEAMLAEAIAHEVVPSAAIVVVADYESNLAGATGGKPGVVVISGGGAIGFGATADGRQALASGYGYLLGDEGSGFSIGRAAIIAAARAHDGRDEPTALHATVLSAFNISSIRDIPSVVYNERIARDEIAQLTPLVVRAAEVGDAVARRIVTWAGNELALTALSILRQLFAPGDAVSVAITGGVFNAGELIQRPFRTALERSWPTATAHPPRFPPVVGAVIVAARAAGIEPDEAWLANIAATLPMSSP